MEHALRAAILSSVLAVAMVATGRAHRRLPPPRLGPAIPSFTSITGSHTKGAGVH